jgi:hypothetical protein
MKIIDPNFLNPSISVFSNCPTCQGLIPIKRKDGILDVEERNCPHCGIQIYREEIIENLLRNVFITQAISSANQIISLDIAIFIFLSVSIFTFFYSSQFPFIHNLFIVCLAVWIFPLILCIGWLYKHGQWVSNDEEYLQAKNTIKKSTVLWITAHFFNLLLLIYKFWM